MLTFLEVGFGGNLVKGLALRPQPLLIDNSHLTHSIRSDQDNRLNIGAHMKEAFHSKATETKPVFKLHEYIV